jgi:putative chitinase
MSGIIDIGEFFAGARKLTGPLNQIQVSVLNDMLSSAADAHWPVSWLAYGLATAWHEARLIPQDEVGHGKGRPYGVPGKHGGQIPYGRGLVQITWDSNYEWADRVLNMGGKLIANYDLANDPAIAVKILILGMQSGHFTGKGLSAYLPGDTGMIDQFTAARRIINGQDRAADIAGYAVVFQNSIRTSGWVK